MFRRRHHRHHHRATKSLDDDGNHSSYSWEEEEEESALGSAKSDTRGKRRRHHRRFQTAAALLMPHRRRGLWQVGQQNDDDKLDADFVPPTEVVHSNNNNNDDDDAVVDLGRDNEVASESNIVPPPIPPRHILDDDDLRRSVDIPQFFNSFRLQNLHEQQQRWHNNWFLDAFYAWIRYWYFAIKRVYILFPPNWWPVLVFITLIHPLLALVIIPLLLSVIRHGRGLLGSMYTVLPTPERTVRFWKRILHKIRDGWHRFVGGQHRWRAALYFGVILHFLFKKSREKAARQQEAARRRAHQG